MGRLERLAAVGLVAGPVTLMAPGAVRDAAAAHDDRFSPRTVSVVSRPWARVRTSTSAPTNVIGSLGGAFSEFSRTITYPDRWRTTENYRWRYSGGYPG